MERETTQEISRLVDGLKEQGFSAEKILECLKYIADTEEPTEE